MYRHVTNGGTCTDMSQRGVHVQTCHKGGYMYKHVTKGGTCTDMSQTGVHVQTCHKGGIHVQTCHKGINLSRNGGTHLLQKVSVKKWRHRVVINGQMCPEMETESYIMASMSFVVNTK